MCDRTYSENDDGSAMTHTILKAPTGDGYGDRSMDVPRQVTWADVENQQSQVFNNQQS